MYSKITKHVTKTQINNILSTKHLPSKLPFYINNLDTIKNIHTQFTTLLPTIKPYYALKCNPNPTILSTLHRLNTNFDCASQSEIESVLTLTKDPKTIIYANPCKSPEDLLYAQQRNVSLLTFDCEEELQKIHKYHPTAQLILRLAVDDTKSLIKFNTKFGATNSIIPALLQKSIDFKLNVVGFSFHVGSCCNDPTAYYKAIQQCKQATDIAQKQYNIPISIIDIGGGFSVRNDFYGAAHQINRAIKDFFPNDTNNTNNIKFIAEPGRYFVETSHTLVVNIIGKKRYNNDHIIYTINESVYQSFNNVIFDYFVPQFIPLNQDNSNNNPQQIKSTIFGQTCDSLDKIATDIMLPELNIGDWLYVENMGAYSYAAASHFNGFRVGKIYNLA